MTSFRSQIMVPSANQESWIEIVEGMKEVIRKRSNELLDMDPEAMVGFAEFIERTLELELNAQTFDLQLEEANSNV